MFDPIITFFETILLAIRRFFGRLVSAIVWPARRSFGWLSQSHWIAKAVIAAVVILFIGLYANFIYQTQVWRNFNPNFVDAFNFAARKEAAGTPLTTKPDGSPQTCQTSAIAQTTATLIDFNVNQNEWVSSMLLYKLGFFGLDWDHTPFFDNKANFQRGINEAVRRSTIELMDHLGRMRGTSAMNSNLQNARTKTQYDEENWYWGFHPFGPITPTPAQYRYAIADLNAYNSDLGACKATFDPRSDNLLGFLDSVASSLGATSDILRERSENYNSGWFDTRADDRFWFAYGQLYGYYAVLTAARADFADVIKQRNLDALWTRLEGQFKAALRITPFIVSNGSESGWIMPTHLATMGFYVLRVRSNITEIRDVLNR